MTLLKQTLALVLSCGLLLAAGPRELIAEIVMRALMLFLLLIDVLGA